MRIFRPIIALLLIGSLLSLSACGFLIYPERRGQTGGKLDATVVLLDAAGLLFAIIPGVIAFAVDIASGTIYLPRGGKSTLEKHLEGVLEQPGSPYKSVRILDAGLDTEALLARLSHELGREVSPQELRFYRYHPLTPVAAAL